MLEDETKDALVDVAYVEEELDVPLTTKDRLEIGERISAAVEELDKLTVVKKTTDAKFNKDKKKFEAIIIQESRVFKIGKRKLPIQVQVIRNYREGYMNKKRMDTGEVLETRQLTRREMDRNTSV